jgi:alkanesulfonate monooxygenase SsuD/methylene tetrahydromethanopterin reductase-like flavin-dependent oxidoreductase (luciferase family)
VHDITTFETQGLPSVFVASSEFQDAAAAQSRALGFDPAVVYVAHPIQDRTDDEMRALADTAVDAVLAALTASAGDNG